jgi:diguanylate cyclase (GGDEF)-like protein
MAGAVCTELLNSSGLALHFIDLDRFKAINDTWGHDGGDFLLKTVAERLRGVLRAEDVAARLGGDEFVVVQGGIASKDEAEVYARRIILARTSPIQFKEQEIIATASVGVSLAPADSNNLDRLLKCANLALYKAKHDGRNCIRFFLPDMDAAVTGSSDWKNLWRWQPSIWIDIFEYAQYYVVERSN